MDEQVQSEDGWSTTRKLLCAGVAVCVLGVCGAVLFPLLLVLMVAGAGAASQSAACAPTSGTRQTAITTKDQVADLNPSQMNNAAAVVATGKDMQISDFGIVVALAAASQESDFLNYANDGAGGDLAPNQHDIRRSLQLEHDAVGTDHGSVGIFQQQYPWWGSLRELMDPSRAARKFYQALKKVDRWQRLPVTVAAQRVQASAYPNAYADDEAVARRLLATLSDAVETSTAGATASSHPASDLCGPGSAMDCPATNLPVEQGLTPDARRVVRCVVKRFSITDLGGVADRSDNPDSDHPSGRAVDVMIDDYQSTQGNQLGWRVARWARTHAKALGITYVIFDQRIWSSQRSEDGWRNYTHPSGKGDATAAHENHVHISVSGNAAGRASRSGGPAVLPVKPGDYELTSPYGYRSNVAGGGTHELHTGQDFAADPGTPIHAATAGTVTTAEACACGYGNYVVIKTGQLEFYYAHQNSLDVHAGQHVKAGQIIGRVGSTGRATGPHLHFEIRRNGHSEDPIPWLEQQGLKP